MSTEAAQTHVHHGPGEVPAPAVPPGPGYPPPGWSPAGPPPYLTGGAPPPVAVPRRRTPAAVWIAVAAAATVLLLAGGLVGGDGPAERTPTTGAAPAGASPAPAHPAPAPAAASPVLAAAFPDIALRSCEPYTPQNGEYTTSSGAAPVAVVRCAYSELAPGAWVYYAQWPDQAAASAYQTDQTRQGPSVDGAATWGNPAIKELGRIHTWQGQGTVWTTGTYDARPFSFDVNAGTVADAHKVFAELTLLSPAQMPN